MFKFKWDEKQGATVAHRVAIFGDDFHRLQNCKSAFACTSNEWQNAPDKFTTEYLLYSYDVPVLMLAIDHDAMNNVNWCTVKFDYHLYRYSRTTIQHVSRFLTMVRALYRDSPSIPTYRVLKTVHDKHMQSGVITYVIGHTLFHKWGTSAFQCLVNAMRDFPAPVVSQC